LSFDVWQILAVGALFAVLSSLWALISALLRRRTISYPDLALLFGAVLVPFAALLLTYTSETPIAVIGTFTLIGALAFAALHLLVLLIELTRPQRLRASRGVLGLFAGLFLAIAAFGVPFAWAFLALETDRPAPSVAAAPTAQPDQTDPASTPADEDAEAAARFADLFRDILGYAADATGLTEIAIIDQLEAGVPFTRVVTDNGGDIELVIRQIAETMRAALRDAVAAGQVNPVQAALALSQMETFVRFVANSDITTLGERFGGGTPDPQATRPSLRLLYQTPEAPVRVAAVSTSAPTPTPLPSATPTRTPPPTLTPTATFTPRPTETPAPPTATRFTFVTRTPVPTPTPVAPCLASVEFNLRLRAAPTTQSETLTVIPAGTTLDVYGRGPASGESAFWWYAEYDGQLGWVDGAFMIVSRACANQPVIAR
jgi:hypothetical protein